MTGPPDPLQSMLGTFSLEVTARDDDAISAATDLLPQGTEIFIANLPGKDPADLVHAAARIRRAGLCPVPHLVGRNISNRHELADLLARLRGEAAPDKALLLGGDAPHPAGPFREALDILETELLQDAGIRHTAFACFPEGHPLIEEQALRTSLLEKLAAAERRGTDASLVSQFAFAAAPILRFVRKLRAEGITAPVRAGIAGPANKDTLLKFGKDLGAGRSLNALATSDAGSRTEADPEALLKALGQADAQDPDLAIEGAHFFAFGSTARTIRWAQEHAPEN